MAHYDGHNQAHRNSKQRAMSRERRIFWYILGGCSLIFILGVLGGIAGTYLYAYALTHGLVELP